MDVRRSLAVFIIGVTGIGLLAIAIRQVLLGITGLAGYIIAGATLVLGAAFTIAAPVTYRTSVSSRHLLRVAGWNTLGVVATSAVLALIYVFQLASDGTLTAPLLSGALIVGVSAFAHVLIGFNDVRRIRAQTVANQRKKATVINRFIRHNLRQTAQLLIGYGERLTSGDETGSEHQDLGEKIIAIGTDLSDTKEQIQTVEEILDSDNEQTVVELTQIISEQQSMLQEEYPDATVETALPERLPALAGEQIDVALNELLDNAFAHGGDPPTVRITGEQTGDSIEIEVVDSGDGFPSTELELINEDRTETKLQHSSGLGLWLAKWIIENYNGSLSLSNPDNGTGGKASVQLSTAL